MEPIYRCACRYIVCACRYIVCACRYIVCACRYIVCACRYVISACRYIVCACRYVICACRYIVCACRYVICACRYVICACRYVICACRYSFAPADMSFASADMSFYPWQVQGRAPSSPHPPFSHWEKGAEGFWGVFGRRSRPKTPLFNHSPSPNFGEGVGGRGKSCLARHPVRPCQVQGGVCGRAIEMRFFIPRGQESSGRRSRWRMSPAGANQHGQPPDAPGR